MHSRAAELIEHLRLTPHPEGGYFREIYRSAGVVQQPAERQARNALTEIYFLLTEDDCSRWHQVALDEVWHYYEGADLELFWIEKDGSVCHHRRLGVMEAERRRPVAVVPAGCWQGARTTGPYTLVGCTVAPGFMFADFRLLRNSPDEAAVIRERFADLVDLI